MRHNLRLSRRSLVRLSIGLLSLSSIAGVSTAQTGLEGFDSNLAEQMLDLNVVELRVQLQSGLRVFLPEQQAFLSSVIAAVDQGRLPRSMVNLVYVWAIRRNPKVPFPYFEVAMRALADRRGVAL